MSDQGDEDKRTDFENEYRLVRWVEDPSGVLFRVEGVKSFGTAGPAFLGAEGGGRLLHGLLRVLNKGLVRVQRPHSFEGCHLEVFRQADQDAVFDDLVDDWEEGRRQANRLVEEIRTGSFVARDADG